MSICLCVTVLEDKDKSNKSYILSNKTKQQPGFAFSIGDALCFYGLGGQCCKVKSSSYITITEDLWLSPCLPLCPAVRHSHLCGKVRLTGLENIPSMETASSEMFPHKIYERCVDEPGNQDDFFFL